MYVLLARFSKPKKFKTAKLRNGKKIWEIFKKKYLTIIKKCGRVYTEIKNYDEDGRI